MHLTIRRVLVFPHLNIKGAGNLDFFINAGQRCGNKRYLLALEVEISLSRNITSCIVSTLFSSLEARHVSRLHFMQGKLPMLPISILGRVDLAFWTRPVNLIRPNPLILVFG